MAVLERRPWRFGAAALVATMLVGWSASGEPLDGAPDLAARTGLANGASVASAEAPRHPAVSSAGRTGGSAPRTTVEPDVASKSAPVDRTRRSSSAPSSSVLAARPQRSITVVQPSSPAPSLAPAASQVATTAKPYEADAPGQKVVVVGDSRLVIETERIAAALQEFAPNWELIGIFGERGATASVAPCAANPSGLVACPVEVQVHRHTQMDTLLSMTEVDAVVVVTGPNEVSARRGDSPPTWDGVAVSEEQVTSAWNAALGEISACHRLWATQQSRSFITTTEAGNSFAANTAAIASGLNNWLGANDLAGRVTTVPWGELADDNVDSFWAAAYHPISPELWFDEAAGDNLHLRAGGGGQLALGRAIGETLSQVEHEPCNVR